MKPSVRSQRRVMGWEFGSVSYHLACLNIHRNGLNRLTQDVLPEPGLGGAKRDRSVIARVLDDFERQYPVSSRSRPPLDECVLVRVTKRTRPTGRWQTYPVPLWKLRLPGQSNRPLPLAVATGTATSYELTYSVKRCKWRRSGQELSHSHPTKSESIRLLVPLSAELTQKEQDRLAAQAAVRQLDRKRSGQTVCEPTLMGFDRMVHGQSLVCYTARRQPDGRIYTNERIVWQVVYRWGDTTAGAEQRLQRFASGNLASARFRRRRKPRTI